MKRPLLLFAISAVLGVVWAQFAGRMALASVCIVMVAAIYCWKTSQKTVVRFTAAGIAMMFMAGAAMLLYKQEILSKDFEELYGREVELRGVICTNPIDHDTYYSFIMKIDEIKIDGKAFQPKGKLRITLQKEQDTPEPVYGDEFTALGELSQPKGIRNPGGFDYRRYLAGQGVSAICYIKRGTEKLIRHDAGNPLIKFGLDLNKRLVSSIYSVLPPQQAGLLSGLLTGYTEGLSDEVMAVFRDAGLLHLVAVSGMQVGLIITVFVWIFRKIGFGPRISNCLTVVFLLLYITITGFTPSVIRASIMGTAILAGGILRRETDALTSISLAAIAMLLYNPYYLFDAGFQLSFCATLSILLLYGHIKVRLGVIPLPGVIIDITALTLSAQIGVLPILAYHFNSISIISLAANILISPLISLVTILGLVIAATVQTSILLARIPALLNCGLLSAILAAAKACAELPFSTLKVSTPGPAVIALYYALVLLWAWKRAGAPQKLVRAGRRVCACFALILVMLHFLFPLELEAYFLDVGQGDSIFIRTPSGKTVLVDGGGVTGAGAGSNMGETVVLPFLLDIGVRQIDIVVATHAHDDHIAGLMPVLAEVDTGILLIPDSGQLQEMDQLIETARSKGIEVKSVARGDEVRLDSKTKLEILHPDSGVSIEESPLNNGSIVLKLTYDGMSMLLTGDIEADAEEILLNSGRDLDIDLLKIPHHGSDTSTTDRFLAETSPKVAIISVGNNNYGHPSPLIIERLGRHSAKLFRTDLHGAVIVRTNGKRLKISKTVD